MVEHPTFHVAAVFVDVGFTLTVYDGTRIAEVATAAGVATSAEAVQKTEVVLRRRLGATAWSFGLTGDGRDKGIALYRTILELAGVPAEHARIEAAARAIWDDHVRDSLWHRLLPGVPEALAGLHDDGLTLVAVSNAEGNLERMLKRIGLRGLFREVLDSSVVGVAKPDPRMFKLALDAAGVAPAQAVMVGDSVPADVEGARAVGLHAALLDPYGFFPDVNVPRFRDFVHFARHVRRLR